LGYAENHYFLPKDILKVETPHKPFTPMFLSSLRTSATRLPKLSTSTTRNFSRTAAIMGVTKTVLKEGNGPIPQKGQTVTIEYTGYLKDTSKPESKGEK
jgi:FK506-binding protein 1